MEQKTKVRIENIIIWIVLIMSFTISLFRESYYILTPIILILHIILLIIHIKDKRIFNAKIIAIVCLCFLGALLRNNTDYFSLISFIVILFSTISLSTVNINKRLLKSISIYFMIISIPSLLVNGFLNPNLVSGFANWGRITPFFYLVFIVYGYLVEENKFNKFVIMCIMCLNIFGLFWTKSRTSIIIFLIILVIYNLIKHYSIDKKIKRRIKLVYVIVILVQICIPSVYVSLYNNYSNELNSFSFELTGKSFFTGREYLWENIIYYINNNLSFGTGDSNYINQENTAHNEFLGIAYIYGIYVAMLSIMFLISMFKRAVNNIQSKEELFLVLSYIGIISLNCFETVLFSIAYSIFGNIIISFLINKRES